MPCQRICGWSWTKVHRDRPPHRSPRAMSQLTFVQSFLLSSFGVRPTVGLPPAGLELARSYFCTGPITAADNLFDDQNRRCCREAAKAPASVDTSAPGVRAPDEDGAGRGERSGSISRLPSDSFKGICCQHGHDRRSKAREAGAMESPRSDRMVSMCTGPWGRAVHLASSRSIAGDVADRVSSRERRQRSSGNASDRGRLTDFEFPGPGPLTFVSQITHARHQTTGRFRGFGGVDPARRSGTASFLTAQGGVRERRERTERALEELIARVRFPPALGGSCEGIVADGWSGCRPLFLPHELHRHPLHEIALNGRNRPWFGAARPHSLRRVSDSRRAGARSWGASRSCSAPTPREEAVNASRPVASRTFYRADAARPRRADRRHPAGSRRSTCGRSGSARGPTSAFPDVAADRAEKIGGRIQRRESGGLSL